MCATTSCCPCLFSDPILYFEAGSHAEPRAHCFSYSSYSACSGGVPVSTSHILRLQAGLHVHWLLCVSWEFNLWSLHLSQCYVSEPCPKHPFSFPLKFTCTYLFVYVHALMCPCKRLEFRRQLVGAISLISIYGVSGFELRLSGLAASASTH